MNIVKRNPRKADAYGNAWRLMDYRMPVLLVAFFVIVGIVAGSMSQAIAETSMAAVEFNNQGVRKLNKGDNKRAMADFNEAIRLNPDYAIAYENRVTVKHLLGDREGAIADYRELIRLRPSAAVNYIQDIIADYSELIRLHPTIAELYINRGLQKQERGDTVGAIEDFNEGIRLTSNNPDYYHYRGIAKKTLGDGKGSAEDFNKENLLRSTPSEHPGQGAKRVDPASKDRSIKSSGEVSSPQ